MKLAYTMQRSDIDVAEDLGLVWCDTVWLDELFPTFRRCRDNFIFD